jgi:hypothetical protein
MELGLAGSRDLLQGLFALGYTGLILGWLWIIRTKKRGTG